MSGQATSVETFYLTSSISGIFVVPLRGDVFEGQAEGFALAGREREALRSTASG